MNARSNYSKIIDQRMNFCKYLNKRNGGNFVANFILSFMSKQGGAFSSCPARKGFYSVRNVTLNSDNLDIPMVQQVLGGNSEIFFVVELGKLVKVGRKMVTIFNITYTGMVKSVT